MQFDEGSRQSYRCRLSSNLTIILGDWVSDIRSYLESRWLRTMNGIKCSNRRQFMGNWVILLRQPAFIRTDWSIGFK